MDGRFLNPANMLTILRIILVPLYLWLFAMKTWISVILALIVFIIAAVSALLITVLTVGFKTIKAAMANPTKSLRYE